MSFGAAFLVLASLQAPEPPVADPPAPSVEAAATPAPEPAPAEAVAPVEPAAPAPAPAPAVTIPPPAEPPAKPERAPAVAKTEATVRTAEHGAISPVTASQYKIGKGFTMATKDGRFSMQIRGRFQFRYDLEHYNAANLMGPAIKQSVQVRRMRLLLIGSVFSPHVKYHFQFGFSPRDMQNDLPNEPGSIRRNPLRDARLEFDRLRDFNVWVGQFKVPFSRNRMLSSSTMNLVDRGIVNAELNLDRDVGVQFLSKDLGGLGGRLAYHVGVFMGEGRNAFELSDPGMMYVGRFEVNPFGKFEDYVEGDLARSRTPGLSIGAAYAFHDRAHALRGNVGDLPADRGTTNFHHMNADLMFKWRGLSFETAFHLRKGYNRKTGGAVDDMGAPIATVAARQGLGWFGQLGYVVPKIPLEVVGRYGLVRNIYGASSSLPSADEAGGGLNYYIVGHDLKVQLDYFRLWDESMGATAGERARHGTDRVRLQLAIYF